MNESVNENQLMRSRTSVLATHCREESLYSTNNPLYVGMHVLWHSQPTATLKHPQLETSQ